MLFLFDQNLNTILFALHSYPWLGVTRGEIITALCSLMHPILYKEHSVIYTKANIFEAITKTRFIDHSAAIASLFLDRFNPRKPHTDFQFDERVAVLRENIQAEVEDSLATQCLLKMIDIVKHTLKTNVYMPNRYALSMRIDPSIMLSDKEQELPYGVFFVHGRRFNAFRKFVICTNSPMFPLHFAPLTSH